MEVAPHGKLLSHDTRRYLSTEQVVANVQPVEAKRSHLIDLRRNGTVYVVIVQLQLRQAPRERDLRHVELHHVVLQVDLRRRSRRSEKERRVPGEAVEGEVKNEPPEPAERSGDGAGQLVVLEEYVAVAEGGEVGDWPGEPVVGEDEGAERERGERGRDGAGEAVVGEVEECEGFELREVVGDGTRERVVAQTEEG